MNDHLIIPKRSHRHQRHLLVGCIGLGILMVMIWGWQMKVTFARFASERQELNLAETAGQVSDQLRLEERASALKQSVGEIKELLVTDAATQPAGVVINEVD